MTELLKDIIPYMSGLYTLPWILVGFVVSALLALKIPREKIDFTMRKIGLVILYFFVPPLVFRVFLDTPMGVSELEYMIITCVSIALMYYMAYLYAKRQARLQNLSPETTSLYIKTLVTNQGRSSAFVGGALLAIPGWGVPAGIFMAMAGVMLFAIVPYALSVVSEKEQKAKETPIRLPWFLRLYPWVFISFVIAAVVIQLTTGTTSRDLGSFGIYLRFYAALTIPMALYYVGSGMHPADLKLGELKKLLGLTKDDVSEHWLWVRQIFLLTNVWTPLIYAALFGALYTLKIIPGSWLAVTVINAALPITSTNIFLVDYGLDKRATVHSVTWSTLLGVPIVVLMIWVFSISF